MHKLTVAAVAVWLLSGVTFRASAQDKLEGILQNELGKVYDGLKQQPQPPYFIDFRVNQMKMWMLQCSSGSLTGDQHVATRVLTVGMGLSRNPVKGNRIPAAIGIPITL